MGWRYGAGAALLVGALSAGACASIVGADFNGLSPAVDASVGGAAGAGGGTAGGGGAGLTGGNGGTSGSGATGATGGTDGGAGTAATGGAGGSGGSATGGSGGSATGGSGGSATGGSGGSATGGSGGSATGGSGGSATGGSGGSATGGSGGADAGGPLVVINEVRGQGGTDYVELKSVGSSAFDLSGWGVTDAQSINGAPNYSTGVYFPSGTMLAPGEYLLVLAQQNKIGGPETSCLGYTSSCYYAKFGISSSGERVYLLDSHSSYAAYVDYPNTLVDGQTWGRIPDGTGSFAANLPTPAATNQAYP